MMELYSKEDADYLIEYYSSKMIGGLLEECTGSKVVSLYKEPFGDKYSIKGNGSIIKGIVKPRRDIELIARTQNLPSPEEVLNQRNSN